MSDQTILYPSPHGKDLSASYWEGTSRGALVLQCCSACGRFRHYAQLICSSCYTEHADWIDASGRGTVHSWTVSHHAFHPSFGADLPYTLATVDLEEGVRALGLLKNVAPDALKIGLQLRATFPVWTDGYGRLTFVPVLSDKLEHPRMDLQG